MAVAFVPTLRRFGLSPLRGLALPGIAAAYMAFTLDSALAEWRGRGGMWKGEAGPRTDTGANSTEPSHTAALKSHHLPVRTSQARKDPVFDLQ